jgi:Ulp1 family protease
MKTALTRAEKAAIDTIMATRPNAVAISAFSINLCGKHVQRFRDREWMDDEGVNMYFGLLGERNARHASAAVAVGGASAIATAPSAAPRCHFFQTFFFGQLAGTKHGYCFENVKRWTRRLESSIFSSFDLVLVPLHVEASHWVLAVINMESRLIQYWDSLGGDDSTAASLGVQ